MGRVSDDARPSHALISYLSQKLAEADLGDVIGEGEGELGGGNNRPTISKRLGFESQGR